MRVFVSSTCFDLIDVRAELESTLGELGITPIMSDATSRGFKLAADRNSIETCLLNVESADVVIVVLNQRYGPKLGGLGFEDVSATHLEYRYARKLGKPIYFYVRNRLDADLTTHRKNKGAEVKYAWALDEELFDFIEEHRKLVKNGVENNWYTPFASTIDLKELVRSHLEPIRKPQLLVESLQNNQFPTFVSSAKFSDTDYGCSVKVSLRNVSLAPAFHFTYCWDQPHFPKGKRDFIPPGEDFWMNSIIHTNQGHASLSVEYVSLLGIKVRERYELGWKVSGMAFAGGIPLIERTFHASLPPSIEILEE